MAEHIIVFGIYFHWPYCLSKCIYCDFGTTILTEGINQRNYAENCKEIEVRIVTAAYSIGQSSYCCSDKYEC